MEALQKVFLLLLALALFLFLLSTFFSSVSSQIVLSDRSTAGKSQGYKNTDTGTEPPTRGGGLKAYEQIIGNSSKSFCMAFNCFVCIGMHAWVDRLAAHVPR